MRLSKLVPTSFIYIQGLSLANPIYIIFISLFIKNCKMPLLRTRQLIIFSALLVCQFLAIWAKPHQLPISVIATMLGLFAFTARSDVLFGWTGTDGMRKAFRSALIWVLVVYLIDSLSRVQYIQFNWVGWSDWELKELVKTSTWLADDSNTLGIRVILLYFIARSVGLFASSPWVLRGLFFYLALVSYSRAALAALLLVFVLDVVAAKRVPKMRYVLPILVFIAVWAINKALSLGEDIRIDSSVISKIDLITGSFDFWWSSGWWVRLLGLGYYSNLDVGTFAWASGHSIVYYALVDFGLLGTLLLGMLIMSCARTAQARWLMLIYSFLGLAVFRFDFLFLYITLFFVEYVAPSVSKT